MIDPDAHFDAPAAFEALWITANDMYAIVTMIEGGDFDWTVAANLIKASRDRLAPYAEPHYPGLKITDPDATNTSVNWIGDVALRIVRDAVPLIDEVKNSERLDAARVRELRKQLLKQVVLAVIDLHDLTYAPNIQELLVPPREDDLSDEPN